MIKLFEYHHSLKSDIQILLSEVRYLTSVIFRLFSVFCLPRQSPQGGGGSFVNLKQILG